MRRTLSPVAVLAVLALLLALLLLFALLAPAAARAGGWANVALSSTPTEIRTGGTWSVDLQVLQHGVTPMEDVEPAVILTGPDGAQRRFAARPTGDAGVYRARVVFPSAGSWRYTVSDGFTDVGTRVYPPVDVAPATPAPDAPPPGREPAWFVAAAACALAGLGLLALRRRPRLVSRPA